MMVYWSCASAVLNFGSWIGRWVVDNSSGGGGRADISTVVVTAGGLLGLVRFGGVA